MRAIAKFLTATFFLAMAGIAGVTTDTQAQGFPVTPGTLITCDYNGPIIIDRGGLQFPGTVSGTATFQAVSVTTWDPKNPNSVNSVVYTPVSIAATSIFTEAGVYTTSLILDPAQPAVLSSISSINSGPANFPARSSMDYNARVTDPSGRPFISVGTVSFVSNNVNSFFPFQGEPFSLAGAVTFVPEDGGTDGFTLHSLNSTFNPPVQ
jgi:hypothetical protein